MSFVIFLDSSGGIDSRASAISLGYSLVISIVFCYMGGGGGGEGIDLPWTIVFCYMGGGGGGGGIYLPLILSMI